MSLSSFLGSVCPSLSRRRLSTSSSSRSLSGLSISNGSSTTTKKRPFTIVVEGNIGSGKTTFLNHFADRSEDVEIFSEPVEKWRNVGDGRHNLLGLMYEDPARWSLLLQTYIQLTMLQQHARSCDRPVKIMERSLLRYSGRLIV